ncbi:MAG: amino acid adenylation domain-containing protein [Oscillospiraceae bacterium]|jgi:amino acid adenylation domain-containing protein|nr:amino acid adenylation domain-containing protein [Oscillospiraceae bacterium]
MNNGAAARTNVEKIYPLTPLQRGILACDKLYGQGMYIVQKRIAVTGTLDWAALEGTLAHLGRKYEVLRTFFAADAQETPVQVVLRTRALKAGFFDLTTLPEAAQERRLEAHMEAVRDKGFDLGREALLKLDVFQMGTDRFELVWTMHHIILDGWSVGILLGDFIRIYTDIRQHRPLDERTRNAFDGFVKWLLPRSGAGLAHWRAYLEGYDTDVTLFGKPPDAAGYRCRAAEKAVPLGRALTERAKVLAQRAETTLNMLVQAVWGVLLQCHSRADDVLFGVVTSGRSGGEDFHQTVGLLINTIPCRVKTQGSDMTFFALLRAVHDGCLIGQTFEYTSLTELQNAGCLARDAVNTILVFENYPIDRVQNDPAAVAERGFAVGRLTGREQTNYGLTVVVMPLEEARVLFQYNAEVFTEAEMTRLGAELVRVLEQVTGTPDMRVGAVSVLDPQAEARILSWSQNSAVDYPRDVCVHTLFARACRRRPDRAAVVCGDKEISYGQLEKRANRLARKLVEMGIGPGDAVCLCCPKSIRLIVGLLAVLKAGAHYVPMDPDYPAGRLAYMCETAGARAVLTDGPAAPFDTVAPVIDLRDEGTFAGEAGDVDGGARPEDPAYVIFTSGTSGQPKGVMVEHAQVVRLFFNAGFPFDFTERDVWMMFHSACFDFSVWEIFGALLFGGTLVVISKEEARDGQTVAEIVRARGVTVFNQVPSAFYSLLAAAGPPLDSLRYLIFGGEALAPDKLRGFMERHPRVKVVNMYGITETTVHTTYKELTPADTLRPVSNIGRPLPTLDAYVMCGDRLCDVGMTGEIRVAGAGLARGYVGNETLTAERFVPCTALAGKRLYHSGDLGRWLESGEIEYLGRADGQVKIRGFRIETKEIEHALRIHAGAEDAAVVVKRSAAGDPYLCAFVAGGARDAETVKERIGAFLPPYMVPARIVFLDALPLTDNCKLDRGKLDDLAAAAGRTATAPQTETEERIAAAMAEILRVEDVGREDDFFDLGGHSLNAARLAAVVEKAFSIHFPLAELFRRPVVSQLAAYVDRLRREEAPCGTAEDIPAAPEAAYYVLSPMQEDIWTTVKLHRDGGTLNIVLPLLCHRMEMETLRGALRDLIRRHHALRTEFAVADGVPAQRVRPYNDSFGDFDVLNFDGAAAEEALERLLPQVAGPFDLEAERPVRAAAAYLGENRHLFVLVMHHIIADAHSLEILCRDLQAFYCARRARRTPDLPPLSIQYADYAVWLRNRLQGSYGEELKRHWARVLTPPVPVLTLNADFPDRRGAEHAGRSIDVSLDDALVRSLRALAQAHGGTLFMGLLTAVYALMHKYTGQRDIVLGTVVSGRDHVQLFDQVGYYLNILPLRLHFRAEDDFTALVAGVREVLLQAFAHQTCPYSSILRAMVPPRAEETPLVAVLVQLVSSQRERTIPFDGGEMEIITTPSTQSKCDLVFNFVETPTSLWLRLEYSTSLFLDATAARIAARFVAVLGQITQCPQRTVGSLLSEERAALSPVRRRR